MHTVLVLTSLFTILIPQQLHQSFPRRPPKSSSLPFPPGHYGALNPSLVSILSRLFVCSQSASALRLDCSFLSMSDGVARDAPPERGPARLTRHALFSLRLEEMRRRGEPTDGMSQLAPTPSHSSEDSRERVARCRALVHARGISSPIPNILAEQERKGGELMARTAERRGKEREVCEILLAGLWAIA
jgi:hypothetical protein